MTLTEHLTSIADAIRSKKKGTNDPIPAVNFASEIEGIESGSITGELSIYIDYAGWGGKITFINSDKVVETLDPAYLSSYEFLNYQMTAYTGVQITINDRTLECRYSGDILYSSQSTNTVYGVGNTVFLLVGTNLYLNFCQS